MVGVGDVEGVVEEDLVVVVGVVVVVTGPEVIGIFRAGGGKNRTGGGIKHETDSVAAWCCFFKLPFLCSRLIKDGITDSQNMRVKK